jgi:predicted RNase H-like HicB family nuclease
MRQFTLEYSHEGCWYVGQLKEWAAVVSQGRTLAELQEMIVDAYQLMMEDAGQIPPPDTPQLILTRRP